MATSSLDYKLPQAVLLRRIDCYFFGQRAVGSLKSGASSISILLASQANACLTQDKTDFRYGSKAYFLGERFQRNADAPSHRHLQATVGEIARTAKICRLPSATGTELFCNGSDACYPLGWNSFDNGT